MRRLTSVFSDILWGCLDQDLATIHACAALLAPIRSGLVDGIYLRLLTLRPTMRYKGLAGIRTRAMSRRILNIWT
jgi:hypothetical protein